MKYSFFYKTTDDVEGIVGFEVDDDTVDVDNCLHCAHLNSSFFFTLVKPTQTR